MKFIFAHSVEVFTVSAVDVNHGGELKQRSSDGDDVAPHSETQAAHCDVMSQNVDTEKQSKDKSETDGMYKSFFLLFLIINRIINIFFK